MKIESLREYNGRNPNGYFNELPPQARMAAWRWLGMFEVRWGKNMPRWRRAILIGQAKRLALTSEAERCLMCARAAQSINQVMSSPDSELAFWVAVNTTRKALDDKRAE